MIVLYLSVIVLLPIAALVDKSLSDGLGTFWDQVRSPGAMDALKLTLVSSLIVVAINAVFGTLIAWVLVRDDFHGKALVNAVIDLPFALPTIVTSIILLAFYGANSPVGINAAFTKVAVVMALAFVTLPFVVRAVQPVLLELDREVEEAAASLGAAGTTIFRRVIFPSLTPALLSGVGLAFARALGEYGSLVLFAAGLHTTVTSVFIRQQIESDNFTGAAAVSVVLLLIALVVIGGINLFQRHVSRHDR